MVADTTEGFANTQGLDCCLRLGGDLRVMLQLEPYKSEWSTLPQSAMVTSVPRLELRVMFGKWHYDIQCVHVFGS